MQKEENDIFLKFIGPASMIIVLVSWAIYYPLFLLLAVIIGFFEAILNIDISAEEVSWSARIISYIFGIGGVIAIRKLLKKEAAANTYQSPDGQE